MLTLYLYLYIYTQPEQTVYEHKTNVSNWFIFCNFITVLKNRCLNVFSTLLYNNNKTAAFIFHFISNSLTVSSLECLLKIEKILLNKRSNIMFYINIL